MNNWKMIRCKRSRLKSSRKVSWSLHLSRQYCLKELIAWPITPFKNPPPPPSPESFGPVYYKPHFWEPPSPRPKALVQFITSPIFKNPLPPAPKALVQFITSPIFKEPPPAPKALVQFITSPILINWLITVLFVLPSPVQWTLLSKENGKIGGPIGESIKIYWKIYLS